METKGKFTYDYERPALATDCVIFGFDGGELKVLLMERETEDSQSTWSLPGGFVYMNETTEESAKRILHEKTGIKNVFVEQLYTFSEVDRDPRQRVVAVAYYALVNNKKFQIAAGLNAKNVAWFELSKMPKLIFDHSKIVKTALIRLKGKVRYQPIGFELLNEKFTLTQLQQLYEAILETTTDKRNFRKKILSMKLLKALNEKEQNVARKAAQYFSFDKQAYKEFTHSGFNFEL
ncbi:MAG: NUDIX hydrolase [Bacteroidia bacterium]|nr:NUDIX hydrolase [Bacteroidia bacterium]